MELTLENLTAEIEGSLKNGNKKAIIVNVAPVGGANENEVVIFSDPKNINNIINSKCGAVVIPEKIYDNAELVEKINKKPLVVVKDARIALMKLLDIFHGDEEKEHFKGIHPSSIVDRNVEIGENTAIGANVVIETGSVIGDNTVIYPNCYIGKGVKIGKNCVIFANVNIYRKTIIHDNVRIHGGSVIGSDGFSYVTIDGRHQKMLQVGIVEIHDDVEIGANVAIDRATIDRTIIGTGTKIDNLVHIAHNVRIGKNCIIAGQVGMAGSAVIKDGVMMGGQAGIADHVVVEDNAIIAAQAGVIGNVKPGFFVTGFPARPLKEFMKAQATLYKWIDKKQSPGK